MTDETPGKSGSRARRAGDRKLTPLGGPAAAMWYVTSNQRPVFIDPGFQSERGNYSEETALKIDAEVKRRLTDAHNTARQVLRERRDTLDVLSARLLENEVIEADELKEIMGPLPPKDPGGTVPGPVPDAGVRTA